jgi:hypothetical protein
MPDMTDMVTAGIQDYVSKMTGPLNVGLMALAPAMAEHLITYLDLQQLWAVGTEFKGKLDDIDDETENREEALKFLASAKEHDRLNEVNHGKTEAVRRLYTTISTDWVPDDELDIEEDLVVLVAQDDPDPNPDCSHDWRQEGDEYQCANGPHSVPVK